MNWEEILMDVGIAAIIVGIIGVIGGLFKNIYDSKKGTEKLQSEHNELKNGQGSIKELIKASDENALSELKYNTAAISNVDKMLMESKINQRRDFESLSKDQKEIKDHMDKFQNLLHDWERQANIIKELENVKQQLIEKNNNLEKKIDVISEETKQLKKENVELKGKINHNLHHDNSVRSSLKDISNYIQKAREADDHESLKDENKERGPER